MKFFLTKVNWSVKLWSAVHNRTHFEVKFRFRAKIQSPTPLVYLSVRWVMEFLNMFISFSVISRRYRGSPLSTVSISVIPSLVRFSRKFEIFFGTKVGQNPPKLVKILENLFKNLVKIPIPVHLVKNHPLLF